MRPFAIFSLCSLFAAPSALAYPSGYVYSRDITPQDLGLEARAVVDALYTIAERRLTGRLVDEPRLVRRGPNRGKGVHPGNPKFASMTSDGKTRLPAMAKSPPHPLPVIPAWVPGGPVLPSVEAVQLGMRPKGQASGQRRGRRRELEGVEGYSF